VFLDRDGTLIDDVGYLAEPSSVRVIPGVPETLAALGRTGWLRLVVTNQSGIARARFTPEQYARVEEAVLSALRASGGDLEGTWHCPHIPDGVVAELSIECDCRKPAPGLLLRAAAARGVDVAASVMVGDALRDLEAGRAAGCGAVVLVRTGRGAADEDEAERRSLADGILDSLADLPEWLDRALGRRQG
jgi:D-glycero-D-manno-heptose 1,7-bisphosphate phosphatase